MEEPHRNRADREKQYKQDNAKASFYEELLECCSCGKIYFSRRPIVLRTIAKRAFHVCAECSETVTCSICGKLVPPDSALVVENLPNHQTGFLCSRCRDVILSRFPAAPLSRANRAWLRVRIAMSATIGHIRRIAQINVWPLRK